MNPMHGKTGTQATEGAAGLTLAQAGELWLQRARREGLEESTVRQYSQHLRLHIDPFLGRAPLRDLTPPVLEAFRDRLLESRSRPMCRKVLTSLKGVFREAQRLGVVQHNPALGLQVRQNKRLSTYLSLTTSRGTIPSKAEVRLLLAHSARLFPLSEADAGVGVRAGTWWHAFFVVALFTGMRESELRGLTWEHVDLQLRVVRVRQRADFRCRLGPPKSAAGNRDIPMAPMIHDVLARWQRFCPPTPLNVVFPSRNGRIQSMSNIHKMCWGPLQLAAGLTRLACRLDGPSRLRPRLPFHSLRHTAASLFIEQGWPPKKVQTVLGHASIQITFDVYGKLWSDLEGDLTAMAALETQLLGSAGSQGETIVRHEK